MRFGVCRWKSVSRRRTAGRETVFSKAKTPTAAHGVWAPSPMAPKLQLAPANYKREHC
jgi:hypothetical protein